MTIEQKVSHVYNHKIRRIIFISASFTAIMCRILTQFSCWLIDNYKHNIKSIMSATQLIKLPMSVLWVIHSVLTLQKLIERYNEPNSKKETAKIVGKSVDLVNDTLQLLIKVKIIYFLVGHNKSMVSHIGLLSTTLSLFISGPIGIYYSYQKYQNSRGTDKHTKNRTSLILDTFIFSLGLLNFALKLVEITDIPINLGHNIIYNFNLSVIVGIIYSITFLIRPINTLLDQLDEPNSELRIFETRTHNDDDNKNVS